MISQYLNAAMEQAHYEIIDDVEPYYGEIPLAGACGPQEKHWRNVVAT